MHRGCYGLLDSKRDEGRNVSWQPRNAERLAADKASKRGGRGSMVGGGSVVSERSKRSQRRIRSVRVMTTKLSGPRVPLGALK